MKNIILLTLVLFPIVLLSQNRYWVGTDPSNTNWSEPTNWSDTPGDLTPDVLGAPSGTGTAIFDNGGTANCTFDMVVSINRITIDGYTGVINLNGMDFNINGPSNSTFATGTVSDGGLSSVNLNSTGLINFDGTVFNASITGSAGRIRFNGSTFNESVDVVNNSNIPSENANGTGGCTFNNTVKITHSGINSFIMGNSSPDVFNGTFECVNSGAGLISIGHNSTGNLLNENLILNNTGGGEIKFGLGGGDITLASSKTISVGLDGFTNGELRFKNFTQVGAASQSLSFTGDATMYFESGTIFNGTVNFDSPQILLNGATFNAASTFEKTGPTDNSSIGGNVFVGNCNLVNSSSGFFSMGRNNADNWTNNITVNNLGSSSIYLASRSAGNTIGGNLIINNFASGSSFAYVYVTQSSTGSINITGDVEIYNNGAATEQNVYLGSNGNVTIGNNLLVENATSGSAEESSVIVANGATSAVVINGTTNVINSGSGTIARVFLGNNGGVTFNGQLSLVNSSSAASSLIFCNRNVSSNNIYNENITVELTNFNADGIYFGNAGGSGTLANSKTINVSSGGFIAGLLSFRNFTQSGATPQVVTLTNNADFESYASIWGGNVTFTAPRITTRESIYNGVSFIEKTGPGNDYSFGANIFNDNVTFKNSGTGDFRATDGNASDYNGDVTYVKSSTGLIQPTYDASSTYAGSINVNSNTVINFGNNTGRVIMDGTVAQSINDIGTSPQEPILNRLRINNSADEVTLNTPVTVQTELDLIAGNIITTSTNVLTMSDNSTVASASNNSFIDGPIQKTGNDLFSFPVGKNGVYRPIQISAPANTFAQFRAEFFPTDPHLSGYTDGSKDPSIHRVSNCEHWMLDRTSSTDAVNVRLTYASYGSFGCSGVLNQSELTVARWNGSTWKDHGNGSFGGTTANGFVETASAVTSFSPFTLASTTANNPLPIELISFKAIEKEDIVDLSWETASEIENDYFTIEKSKDGINFTPFDKVLGAGNSAQNTEYSSIDKRPFEGDSYYRLKQTDYNGKFTYSSIEKVNFKASNAISIYPNPVESVLTVNGLLSSDVVFIYGVDGKLVYSGISSTVNVEDLSNGVYQLVIAHENGTKENIKFIK
jgi:hypothetical protein